MFEGMLYSRSYNQLAHIKTYDAPLTPLVNRVTIADINAQPDPFPSRHSGREASYRARAEPIPISIRPNLRRIG